MYLKMFSYSTSLLIFSICLKSVNISVKSLPYLPLLSRNMFDLVWAFIVGKALENDEQRLTHKADVISRFRALSGPDNDLSAKHIRLWNWYLGWWIEVVIRSVVGILYAYSICLTFEYTERIHVFIFSPLAKQGTC